MNKKVIIAIVIAVIVAIAGGVSAFVLLSKPKTNPEDIWQSYISLINEQKYEEMYAMLTEESKAQISQEDFIKRNKNIYEGIDMTDMTDDEFALHGAVICQSSYGNRPVEKAIEHPAVTEKQWVVDKEAYKETVVTGYRCECGETQ